MAAALGSVWILARQVPVMAEPASASVVARPPWPWSVQRDARMLDAVGAREDDA